MGLATLDGLYITVLFLLPGWAAGFPMRYWTGLPPSQGPIEPLFRALGRSAFGYLLAELLFLAYSREFGSFVLTPLLAGDVTELGSVSLTWEYGVAALVVIAAPTCARRVLQRPGVEKRLGLRTIEQATLHRLRRYMKAAEPHDGEDSPPYVRVQTSKGEIEGWLRWAADGVEADQALIVVDDETEDVAWIPVRSIVSFAVVMHPPSEAPGQGDNPAEGE